MHPDPRIVDAQNAAAQRRIDRAAMGRMDDEGGEPPRPMATRARWGWRLITLTVLAWLVFGLWAIALILLWKGR